MKIKNLALLFFLVTLFASCDIRNQRDKTDIAHTEQPVGNYITKVQMIDSVYDFGQVTDGEKVVFSYRFTNGGDHPLIIAAATASCGCTVPEKPEQPIATGEQGYIKVVFDSKGRVGPVHKEIRVQSNAEPGFPVLQLKGEVLPANK